MFRVLLLLPLAPPGTAPTAKESARQRMKAVVHREFGSPEVLRIEELDKPVPRDDELLVHVRAAALNPLDWHFLEGTPYIARPLAFGWMRPTDVRIGVDYS